MGDLTIDVNLNEKGEIRDSSSATSNQSTPKTKRSMGKEASGGVTKALKGLGIVSALSAVVGILRSFKPLMTMVSQIVKMVTLILSPIADVILVALYPILLLMRPIVTAINQIMLPFIKQGLAFMREGVIEDDPTKIGAGVNTILAGLSSILIFIQGETIKLVMSSILYVVGSVVSLFNADAGSIIINTMIPIVDDFVNTGVSTAFFAISAGIVSMGETVSSDMTSFKDDMITLMDGLFTNLDNDTIKAMDESLQSIIDNGVIQGMGDVMTTSNTIWQDFGSDMRIKIADAFEEINKAFDDEVELATEEVEETVNEKWWSFLKPNRGTLIGGIVGGITGAVAGTVIDNTYD